MLSNTARVVAFDEAGAIIHKGLQVVVGQPGGGQGYGDLEQQFSAPIPKHQNRKTPRKSKFSGGFERFGYKISAC